MQKCMFREESEKPYFVEVIGEGRHEVGLDENTCSVHTTSKKNNGWSKFGFRFKFLITVEDIF